MTIKVERTNSENEDFRKFVFELINTHRGMGNSYYLDFNPGS